MKLLVLVFAGSVLSLIFSANAKKAAVKRVCLNANWWNSFNKSGWSNCGDKTRFITGFYRSKIISFNKDEISKLEEARCCISSRKYRKSKSTCKIANWWRSLNKPNTWSFCSKGYFLNGLFRTKGNNLHNIEMGYCCKPVNHPKTYGHCYYKSIKYAFNKKGWTTCGRVGFYIAGLKRGRGNWLHNIDYLKCCRMFIHACARRPCKNGGLCKNIGTSYQCKCRHGYKGKNCQIESFCLNANWWKSFDKKGWSHCGNIRRFITGFYRSRLTSFKKDEISKLEAARCCKSTLKYKNRKSICKNGYWVKTLDKPGTWSVCPRGYFLNGLYRSSGNNLHNIELGKCCKPKGHPNKYVNCYNELTRQTFDKKGWSRCKRIGYYVAGLYKDRNGDWLHNIDKLKCCKMFRV
ncbi:uncharacterized protein LOC124457823 [Xenia sp. Carnegie-2017]|uniref:uncharacterized protein LOC124457823 n=1 Tax=Xenia sp. Carnegie-2017 TaxID=2897299 RepID=UPI001F0500C2|nr:uncharacterized protein LOC124457823 [Xenia sp. Carnegie-2017]